MITFTLIDQDGSRRTVKGIMTPELCYLFPDGMEHPLCTENTYEQDNEGGWEIRVENLRRAGPGEVIHLEERLR